jgi:DNA polymerase-3 subunit alpha
MSTDRSFVHLHCHSHYSLLDGASRIPELVRRVKEQGMNAVALTDHGNLYGAIELYREATAAGIKPIIGYEAYVAPGHRTSRDNRGISGEASYHLTLLAKNNTGFKNLIKMASVAFLEGYYYRPRIDKELLEAHSEGLICLSGCASSEFSTFILKDQMKEARQLAEWFHRVFRDNFYVEIQNNGLDIQRMCYEGAVDIAQKVGLPIVATCDAHYLCQGDADTHDVLLCINTKRLRSDQNRMRYGSDQFYVRGPEEMYNLFPEQVDAVRRSQEIADQCDLQLDFKKRHFPVFTPPEGKKPEDYLRELCERGLTDRYGANPPQAVRDRLELELGVISRLGFAGYFLIVWDFVRFAQERKIPCGARGSACGALVSYVLKFSHVDPLEYDLLFERFLDPNRAEAPDIDIDFCQEGRDAVIQYVKEKYGEKSVAQIVTFGTLAARAAVKDVGRVLGMERSRTDQLAQWIPARVGMTLDDALSQSPDLRKAYDTDPQVREVIDIARKLEGTNRNAGVHAAGVVIANGDLSDYVPLHTAESESAETGQAKQKVVTTQWTMEDLEKVGLLKMDFLGLRTLTMIDDAVKLIKQNHHIDIDVYQLPLDDAATYALLQSGDAQGVFQFESDGIRGLLQRMKPDNIRDLIACTALYRPGPMQGGMHDAYVNRKHGREKPDYAHEVMREILSETHGIMVYQEQVMRVLNRLGGIELSSAYACIKAISKKKQDTIDQRRAEFIAGAKQRGLAEETARDIFQLIVYFGGYGFNKSHSAAYALVSYQTAYLKAHYPAEFLAAVLISETGKTEKMVPHIEAARRRGLEVLPPDVNASDVHFSVQHGKVRFSLAAIRGMGIKAAETLVAERQANGPYRDLFDLCERIDQRTVSRAAVEALIKAGGMDAFGVSRAALMTGLAGALQAGSNFQEDRRHGQKNIFDMLGGEEDAEKASTPRKMQDLPEWHDSEKLANEKDALGFYFSSHPLARHEETMRRYSSYPVSKLTELPGGADVLIGGMLTNVRFTNAKRSRSGNTQMARGNLEDLGGSIEWVIFPDDYLANKEAVRDENVCFVKATVDRSRDTPGLIINRIMTVEQAQRESTRGLLVKLISGTHNEDMLSRIGQMLQRTPGRCPVFLEVTDPGGRRAVLRLGEPFAVDMTRLVIGELETLLGPGQVHYIASSYTNGRNGG